MQEQLLAPTIPEAGRLAQQIVSALEGRLSGPECYSRQELEQVSELESRIFPACFCLDKQHSDRFRALCSLSQAGLKQTKSISSHRRLIGPLIVTGKRALWKLVRPQLDEAFRGFEAFSSWMVYSHAQQLVQLKELETKLLSSSDPKLS